MHFGKKLWCLNFRSTVHHLGFHLVFNFYSKLCFVYLRLMKISTSDWDSMETIFIAYLTSLDYGNWAWNKCHFFLVLSGACTSLKKNKKKKELNRTAISIIFGRWCQRKNLLEANFHIIFKLYANLNSRLLISFIEKCFVLKAIWYCNSWQNTKAHNANCVFFHRYVPRITKDKNSEIIYIKLIFMFFTF